MSVSHEVTSARVQSRATIWAALIGSAGVVLAAWIGVHLGRNQGQEQGQDKLNEVHNQVDLRDREIAALRLRLSTYDTNDRAQSQDLPARREPEDSAPEGSAPLAGSGGESAGSRASQQVQEVVRPCPRNNTFQCAAKLPFGVRDDDGFNDVHDARYYQFELDQPGQIKLTLDPMPNTRFVVVTVHDAEYTEVSRRRFDAGQPGSFNVRLNAAGRYYAALEPGSCCSGAPYTFGFAIRK